MTCTQSEKLETLGRITGLGDKVTDLDVLPPSLEDLYAHFSRGPQP
jgi:Cu-processing system ATP-binding protein